MGHVAGGRRRTLGGTPGGVSARSDQPARHGEVADQFDLQIGRPAVTRRARIASLLAPAERRSLVGMVIVILALHVVGWGVLAGMVAPHSFSLGSANLDLPAVGLVIALAFVGIWVLALAVWRFGRIEERW